MRILIVGAGSVGGYFGGRLAEAGRDVTFLVRPARAEQLRRDGLRIKSPHGDAVLAPRLVLTGAKGSPFDLILLSVKAYSLDTAAADFAPAVGPQTVILPLLNGLRHLDRLAKRFGEEAVIGGVCQVIAEVDRDGSIVQMADLQRLSYGERGRESTARIRAIDEVLRGAGFDTVLSPDILQAMWEKWVQLSSLGALTCLMRATVGGVAAVPGGEELARALLAECVAVATASGHPPSAELVSRHGAALTEKGSPATSSMYRDLRKGAPVEVDHILGDLLQRGVGEGVATPLLNAAFINLRIYQAGLTKRA